MTGHDDSGVVRNGSGNRCKRATELGREDQISTVSVGKEKGSTIIVSHALGSC